MAAVIATELLAACQRARHFMSGSAQFGALDAQVRKELRRWLRQLHEELQFTSVFVTHDQEEATEVADRVVVMSAGPASHPLGEFVIDIARPRDVAEIKSTPRFRELHAGIWDVLREEVLKGYQQQLQKAA